MRNHRNRKLRDGIFNGVFIFYLAFLLENILFKYVQPWQLFQHGRSLNLVPFRQIIGSSGIGDLNIYGNIILFVPLGIYLMFFIKRRKAVKSLLAVFGISLFFEAFQYAAAIGATDIDDIILNCAGGILGVICYKVLLFVCMGKEEKAKTVIACIAAVVGMITAVLTGLLIAFN